MLHNLRIVIDDQPFLFQIRAKQEQLLKVRNFLPPQAQEPEIFLLEKLIDKQVESKIVNGDMFGDKDGETILTGLV